MKVQNLTIILSLICIITFTPRISKAGTDAAAFLNIGVGARALAMGGAFTSVSDDATASYWNPAGLATLNNVTLSTMIQSLAGSEWEGMSEISPKYQFIGAIIPSEKIGLKNLGGTFAISWIHCGIDDVSYTWMNTAGDLIRGSFKDSENAYFISYGRNLLYSKELLVGGTFKFVTQKFSEIEDASASGYDLDAGLIYSSNQNLRLGFLVQKGTQLKWANQHTDNSPLKVKVGSSYKFLNKKSSSLLGAIDVVQAQKEPLYAYMGSEFNYAFNSLKIHSLSLRAGIDGLAIEDRYGNISELNNHTNWTFGSGIKIKIMNQIFQIDYAFGSYRIGSKHRISLITEFF